jgi:hypothetical protein
MEMTQSFRSFQSTQAPAPPYGAAIYTHPSDGTNDLKLTTAEKRMVLASWISDARAVENAPALRRIESGVVVHVDEIRRALVSLDELEADRKGDGKRLHRSARRRRSVNSMVEAGRSSKRFPR